MSDYLEFSYEPTFGEQYWASLALLAKKPLSLATLLVFPAASVFLICLSMYCNRFPGVLELWTIMFGIIFIPTVTASSVYMSRRKNRTIGGSQTMVFEASGLSIKGATFDLKLGWDAVVRVAESKNFLFFFFSSQMAYYLPKRIVGPDHKVAELRDILSQFRGNP